MARRKISARDRILNLLSQFPITNSVQLQQVGGYRYSARLFELRKMGFTIHHRQMANRAIHHFWLDESDKERANAYCAARWEGVGEVQAGV